MGINETSDLHLGPEDMETTEQREQATGSLAEVCRGLIEKHGKFITQPREDDLLINFRKMEFTDKESKEYINILKIESPLNGSLEEYPNDYVIKFFPENSEARTVYTITSGKKVEMIEIDENNHSGLPKKLSALKTEQLQKRLEDLTKKNSLL